MNLLTINKKGDTLSTEDKEKIEKLKAEREECLQPVRIRITGDLPSLKNNGGTETPTGKTGVDGG